MPWEVDVGIRWTEDRDVWDVQDEVDQIVGYHSHSSGAGFGYRDLQYPVPTPWRARSLVREIGTVLNLDESEDYVSSYYQAPSWVWKVRYWFEEGRHK